MEYRTACIVKNGEFVTPINDKRYKTMRAAEAVATRMNNKLHQGYVFLAAIAPLEKKSK